jgi:hypothetical protein
MNDTILRKVIQLITSGEVEGIEVDEDGQITYFGDGLGLEVEIKVYVKSLEAA